MQKKILKADLVTLHFLLDANKKTYLYEVHSGTFTYKVPQVFPPRMNEEGIGWRSVRDRCPKVNQDVESTNEKAYKEGSRSYAAFPLLIEHNKQKIIEQATAAYVMSEDDMNQNPYEPVVGVMYVHFQNEHVFTQDELDRGQLFSERCVDAIWQAMTFQQVRDKSRQLVALQSVTQFISQAPENADLLSHIAWNTLNVLAADVVIIYTYNRTQEKFAIPPIVAGRLIALQEMMSESPEKHNYLDIPTLLIDQREPIYLSNVLEHPTFRESIFLKKELIQSFVGRLLMVDEDVVGVILINYRRHHNFSKEEKETIKTLSSSAATAIKNQTWLQTLSSIDQKIITTLDSKELLHLIIERAVNITGADLGVLCRQEEVSKELTEEAIYTIDRLVDQSSWYCITIGEGLAGKVAQLQKPELVEYVLPNTIHKSYLANAKSELCVPLIGKQAKKTGKIVVGVLYVASQTKKFTQRDLQKLQVLSDLAVIAIQNSITNERFLNTNIMATIGTYSTQLLHLMNSDIGALKSHFNDITNIDRLEDYKPKIDKLLTRMGKNIEKVGNFRSDDPEKIDIQSSIFEVLQEIEIQSEINLQVNLSETPTFILAGKHSFLGIFVNIIRNAIDAMPNGGTLWIESDVIMELEIPVWVKINISDTGVGIAEENLERVFEMGFTTKATKDKKGNIGWGLWWSKIQLDNLGGKIIVNSKINEGTQIKILIPIIE
jgi:GAF domain-containing protein